MKQKTNAQGFTPIIILVLLAVAFVGYFGYKYWVKLKTNITPTPVATTGPTANWKIYTTKNSVLSFKLPPNYTIKENGQELIISTEGKSPDSLSILYSPTNTRLTGPSGAPAGKLASTDSVEIFGQKVSKFESAFENKITGVSYGGPPYKILLINSYQFIIFQNWGLDSKNGISKETENIFDQILSTFKFIGQNTSTDPTTNWETYTNVKYKFSFKFPTGWDIKTSDNFNFVIGPAEELTTFQTKLNQQKVVYLMMSGPGQISNFAFSKSDFENKGYQIQELDDSINGVKRNVRIMTQTNKYEKDVEYVLSGQPYNASFTIFNKELESTFDQIISTFKFIQ